MSLKSLFKTSALVCAIGLPFALASGANAKTFRLANDGDIGSMDPYFRNETVQLFMNLNVYEGLVRWNRDIKLEPALAESWSQPNPTTWRFVLRKGVKFHDGTPFTAEDVVFSYQRASTPPSNMTGYFASFQEAKKVDDYTVDVITKYPDPLMATKLWAIGIMSKAWAAKNGAEKPTDVTKPDQENFSTRNENGTGHLVLKSREPGTRTQFTVNPNWWNKSSDSNIDELDFRIIANPATRTAALLTGEVDMVYSVPPQDVDRISNNAGTKILQKPETRVVYFGFDVMRDELLESNVKGKNPFKDIRVREAFYRAIDTEAIKTRVMRGQSQPTALMIPSGTNGYDKALDVRPKYDPELSKKLLTEAGYPNGFEVGLDCPNDRYVNDEAICQATVAMLARVGIKVNLNAQTKTKYFAKILPPNVNTSFYMLGWSPSSTYDAHNVFEQLVQTRNDATKKGAFNVGGYSNPKIDDLADKMEREIDTTKRNAMIQQAIKLAIDDYAYLPIHQQVLIWAVRDNVELHQPGDNLFYSRFIKLK